MMNQFQRTFFLIIRKILIFESALIHRRTHNRLLTKLSIVEHLWGNNVVMADSLEFIYTHIKNLRKKIVEKGGNDYIKTVYGLGYKFSDL